MTNFYIGQTFTGIYPPEAAVWCNANNAVITSIEGGYRIDEVPPEPVPTLQEKEAEFDAQFFNTSLGYVRRKVTMKDGNMKDFLSDILPLIAVGADGVPVVAYTKPDFATDDEPTPQLVVVTQQFIDECKQQVLIDFYGGEQ
jgi:hypothetical protein